MLKKNIVIKISLGMGIVGMGLFACYLINKAYALETIVTEYFNGSANINAGTINNVSMASGSAVPGGVTPGELESDPSMTVLFHLNGDTAYNEDNFVNIYDFSHQRHHAFWSQDDGLFPASGMFNTNAYYYTRTGTRRWFGIISNGINTDNMTVAFWINISEDTASLAGSGEDIRLCNSADYHININSGNSLVFIPGSGDSRLSARVSDLSWQADTWHHIAAVLKSGNNKLFVDGQLVDSHDYSGTVNIGSTFTIGKGFGLQNLADVKVDEFAMWNRALHDDEIAALGQGNRIRTGSFESNWMDIGGSIDAVRVSLTGTDTETITIYFSSDGSTWKELKHGEWISYAHLDQLPCDRFKYKVRFSGGSSGVKLDILQFEFKNIVEDPNGPFSFIVYGDSRSRPLMHQQVVWQIEAEDAEMVFNTGDIVTGYSTGRDYEWSSVKLITQRLVDRKGQHGLVGSYFPSPGNHDKPDPFHGLFDTFNYPPVYTTTPENPDDPFPDPDDASHYYNRYYAFTYKNALFVSLNVYDGDHRNLFHGTYPDGDTGTHKPIDPTDLSAVSAQYKWLYQVLETAHNDPTIEHKFIFLHPPFFSTGGHGSSLSQWGAHAYLWLRQHLCPLFEHFNVDIVFSAHDHMYIRTYPLRLTYDPAKEIAFGNWPDTDAEALNYMSLDGVVDQDNGVTYLVTGGGGTWISDPGPSSMNAYAEKTLHLVKITIAGDKLNGVGIRPDGSRFDSFGDGIIQPDPDPDPIPDPGPEPDPDPDPDVYVEQLPVQTSTVVYNNIIKPGSKKATIHYEIEQQKYVQIIIYNFKGIEVFVLVDGVQPAGTYDPVWAGTDSSGNALGSGIYFVRIELGKFKETKKIIIVK